MKTGLCLAGGGSYGILITGYLKAIEEKGIKFDFMTTSSVGTTNGLLYSVGGLDALYKLWLNVKTSDIYKTPWCKLTNLKRKQALNDSAPLARMIREVFDYKKLQNLPYDVVINATGYTAGQHGACSINIKDLDEDELKRFALASASPPFFFPLVKFRGGLYGDAGVTNNYAINQAMAAGCDTIILMLPSKLGQPKQINAWTDLIAGSLDLAMKSQLDLQRGAIKTVNKIIDDVNQVLEPDYRKINLITIEPDRYFDFDFLDFDFKGLNREELIDYGYEIANKAL